MDQENTGESDRDRGSLTPLPVGTVVDYHGSHTHGRYVVTAHEAVRDSVPDPEVNYPDGVGYVIWREGQPQKFGNRHHMVSQVRRSSITETETK
jgi:hypothetical protein